jgi:hypothetical protein
MDDDGDGFFKIAPSHDPKKSAASMLEFAKAALAHSKTVMMPRSNIPVTVSAINGEDGFIGALLY